MGFSMGDSPLQSFNPKHKIIIRSSNPGDEEAIKDLEQVLMKKFFVFLFFFLSFFLSSHHPFLINVLVAAD
jgi:hypothetical protein